MRHLTIRGARNDKGLNQTQVAKAMGLSLPTYGDIERNPERITWKQAKQLAKILERRIEEFTFYDEEVTSDD